MFSICEGALILQKLYENYNRSKFLVLSRGGRYKTTLLPKWVWDCGKQFRVVRIIIVFNIFFFFWRENFVPCAKSKKRKAHFRGKGIRLRIILGKIFSESEKNDFYYSKRRNYAGRPPSRWRRFFLGVGGYGSEVIFRGETEFSVFWKSRTFSILRIYIYGRIWLLLGIFHFQPNRIIEIGNRNPGINFMIVTEDGGSLAECIINAP